MDIDSGPGGSDENWPGDLKWGRMAVSEEVGLDEGDSPLALFGPNRSFFDQIKVEGLLGDNDQTIMLEFLGQEHEVSTLKVIYGLNGTGKSTLLRLVESLIDRNIPRLLTIPFRELTLTRTERLGEEWDNHEYIRPGLSVFTFDPANVSNFISIHPWQNEPPKLGRKRIVDGKEVDLSFDHPSLTREETLKVKKWADKHEYIVTWNPWADFSDEEIFDSGGAAIEIQMPDYVHSLKITKFHNGMAQFTHRANPKFYDKSKEEVGFRKLFDILEVSQRDIKRFFGEINLAATQTFWEDPGGRYNALWYELGREKATQTEKKMRMAQQSYTKQRGTITENNLLFRSVKDDVLSLFKEQSLHTLTTQGHYRIDGAKEVLDSYLGRLDLSDRIHSLVKDPLFDSKSHYGSIWRADEQRIKTLKLVLNTDLENNRDHLLKSVRKLLKSYSNTLQIVNYNFFNYDSAILNNKFFKAGYPDYILKSFEEESLVHPALSLGSQRAIWRSIGKSVLSYFENPKIQSSETHNLLRQLWIDISHLAYQKDIQNKSTWAKKWKHPATAIGQRPLSLLNEEFELNAHKVKSQYNRTFCGVEILNELYENKELILDGEMNIIVKDGISIEDLSHGELRLINIIISIHMSLLRSRGESLAILIDEPELGLHLRWQSKLMDALGNLLRVHRTQLLNCRIILASHSPEIVGSYPHLSTSIRTEGTE